MSAIENEVYWVVKNKLLGVRKPASEEEVLNLKRLGVPGIITLLDDKENHKLYRKQGIDFLWTPIKGGSVPSLDQVKEGLEFAKKVWGDSKVLAIHCSGGKKRTATMIASILCFGPQFSRHF